MSGQYLIVPIERKKASTVHLREALELVARENGYKTKITKFLKEKLGCSSNSVKHMLKTLPGRNTDNWDLVKYPTKDAYKDAIRKLDITKYAKVVNLIVSEYIKATASTEKESYTNMLRDNLKEQGINPQTYQRALCHDSIKGLEIVTFDPITANRINNISNAKHIADGILNDLLQKEVII